MYRIDVIIPARKVANEIKHVIGAIPNFVNEIYVIDDGSPDTTREAVSSMKDPRIHLIRHEINMGKGAAMKTGVKNSNGDIIVFIDGDGAFYPTDIEKLTRPMIEDGVDLVIGSRFVPGAEVRGFSIGRFLAALIASTILSIFSLSLWNPVLIIDVTSGFRAIKREKWNLLDLVSNRFEIETEINYEAIRRRLRIKEVPIRCDWDCNTSTLDVFRDSWKTLKLLISKRFNHNFFTFDKDLD